MVCMPFAAAFWARWIDEDVQSGAKVTRAGGSISSFSLHYEEWGQDIVLSPFPRAAEALLSSNQGCSESPMCSLLVRAWLLLAVAASADRSWKS